MASSPCCPTVQFARLVTVTPYLCDVNALGIAVGTPRAAMSSNNDGLAWVLDASTCI